MNFELEITMMLINISENIYTQYSMHNKTSFNYRPSILYFYMREF